MKKLLCLLLVLCILFCVGCASTQGGDGTPPESSGETTGEEASVTLLTMENWENCKPAIGHYEFERDGILVGVDFWDLPRPWFGERIEGTVTYTNNTGEEISGYLHAYVEMGGLWNQDEIVSYSTAPRTEPNEQFATVTEEAPLLLNLTPGETVTMNFSVEVPAYIQYNDAHYDLFFLLYENETPKLGELICSVYFLVH